MFSDVTHDSPRRALTLLPATQLPGDHEEQAALLEAMIAQSRDAVLIAESEGLDLEAFRLLYANPAFVQMGLGKAVRGLILGQALSTFSEALAHPAFQSHVRATLAAGLSVRGEPLTGSQEGLARYALLDVTRWVAALGVSSAGSSLCGT